MNFDFFFCGTCVGGGLYDLYCSQPADVFGRCEAALLDTHSPRPVTLIRRPDFESSGAEAPGYVNGHGSTAIDN